MSLPSLSAAELIAWNQSTTQKWREFTAARPEVLEVPCDVFGSSTCGGLLRHIVASELRYADLLAGYPAGNYAGQSGATSEEIFETHDRALRILDALLKTADFDWEHKIEFPTLTAGLRRAPRRAIFFHCLLHGIRHYAQLATIVRQAGFPAGLAQDYLLMDSEPA